VELGFELRLLSYFGDGILRTICLGLPGIVSLPLSVSQVARIIDVSHWHLAEFLIF
jgi:hypothetical protein